MGYVAAQIFKRSNERQRRERQRRCECCCGCRQDVKQKKFRAKYSEEIGCYVLLTEGTYHGTLPSLTIRDAHKEAAERIAEIYNEVITE